MSALSRLLPSDPRARRALIAVATTVALLLLTQLGFSGGTPAALLFSGLCVGAATAVTTSGIVLVYRTLRIINFSQVALGVAGTILTFELVQFTPVPFPVAFLLGVGLSAALGAVIGTVTLRFFSGSRLFLTVVTIVAASVLGSLSVTVRNLPFFPPEDERTTATLEAAQASRDLLPFSGFDFQVGSFPLSFGFPHVFALEMALVVFLVLGAFFRFTRAGTAVRGLAENSERASLLGIGVGGLSVLVWAIAGALAGVGVILNAGLSNPNVATGVGFVVLLPALAAAVLARMTSLPVAIYAAVAIGVFKVAFENEFRSDTGLFDVVLFAIIAVGLLLQRHAGRSETGAGVAWSATDEPRAIPKELRGVAGVRVARLSLIGLLALAVVVFPFVGTTQQVVLFGVVALNAIAVVSLVVLTGWAGQVSLAQFAFVAIGSVVGGAIVASTPVPFWFAVPLAAAVTGAVAVVVGLPALRIQGLFLLVATFAFAVVVREVLFSERYFGWLLPEAVERPTLFFIDFENERAMYFLCMAALALAVVIVTNLRKSRIGRILIAVRENEANAQAFGVSAVRMKLVAFGISGALCGFAGAVFAAHQQGVSANSFGADAGIGVFIAGVFGGVSSVSGALLGATYFKVTTEVFSDNLVLQAVLQQGGTLYLLFLAPGGLISLLVKARDSVLRVVAQRRQLIVPSLFADTPPDALEKRLIPLGASDGASGLAALPPDQRYILGSELYRGRGGRILGKLPPAERGSDAAAIGAAAARADDVGTGAALTGSRT